MKRMRNARLASQRTNTSAGDVWLSSLLVCDRMAMQSILSREEWKKCQKENAQIACS